MAEALWCELGGGAWESHSAGSNPTGAVHPLALEALRDDGIVFAAARSKSVREFDGQTFDWVVTVCDSAQEACPAFPGSPTVHWPFPDPADAQGSEPERLAVFVEVREAIRRRIAQHLQRETAEEFTTWVDQQVSCRPGGVPDDLRLEYRRFVAGVAAHWDSRDGHSPWLAIPRLVLEIFGSRGFAWNGL